MNSQNKDPSIAAAEAAARQEADARPEDGAGQAPAEGDPPEDVLPVREERRPRAGQGAGAEAARAERLRTIKGGRGQGPGGPGNGLGRGPRALQREAFVGTPDARDLPERVAPARLRPAVIDPGPVRQPVAPASLRPRHRGIMALAFAMILLPGLTAAVYLWGFAVDQYVSTAGFSIRNQSAAASPFEILGAFAGGSSSTTAKDTDILYNFVGSQQLVQKLDKELDLRAIYSKPQQDPVFAYDTSGTIEDLVDYWSRMVQVEYDTSTGLMQLRVYAFTPEDAQRIVHAVLDESTALVNRMAAVARDDTTKYAKQSLADSEAKLQEARAALTRFRVENSIVDPTLDISSQSSVVGTLTQQLVQAQIELSSLEQGTATANDPRIAAIKQRISVIQARIDEEQAKVAAKGGDKGYAEIIATYQTLAADLEFNEQAYLGAMAAYDAAVEEAQHKQVYLATYEEPTLAEASTAPRRFLILAAIMVVGFLSWAIVTLVYYALRDRR